MLAVAAALSGCGGGDDKSGLTNGQVQALVAQLEAARTTALAGDVAGTRSALAKFRRSVARLERQGLLSDDAARALRVGATRIGAAVQPASDPAPATPTETSPLPPVDTESDEDKDDEDEHKGKGKGKGNGKGKKKGDD